MWNHTITSEIIIGASGGAIAGLTVWIVGLMKDWVMRQYHGKKVFKWLKNNIKPNKTGFTFRTTKTIASFTNLSQDRVRFICSFHKKICENSGTEDSWGIWEISRNKSDAINHD